MKKQVRLMGRYLLLMTVAGAVMISIVGLSILPDWLHRLGGVIGAGWWAMRLIGWSMARQVRK